MASLPVLDRTGKEVGRYEIAATDLAPTINKQLLHDAVVMYQANLRQGTFRTKTRGEVAGSTKKMYRQKGTGNARAGSRRTNIRVGGGHAFAKRPRDFGYRLPRKALQLATRMAIASKIESQSLVVIDDLQMSAPKTKEAATMLRALQLEGQSTLVTTNAYDVNVYKSLRNIARVTVSPVAELNALSVLKPKRMLVTRSALDALKSKVSEGQTNGSKK
jgi:large subunit ribosomal protein L4